MPHAYPQRRSSAALQERKRGLSLDTSGTSWSAALPRRFGFADEVLTRF